jgi:hypothetical protein
MRLSICLYLKSDSGSQIMPKFSAVEALLVTGYRNEPSVSLAEDVTDYEFKEPFDRAGKAGLRVCFHC